MDFVESASLLYAVSHCIPTEGVTREQVVSLAGQVAVPQFKPREGVKIATTDQEAQEMSGAGTDADPQSVSQGLRSLAPPDGLSITPLDFEKVPLPDTLCSLMLHSTG